MLTREKKYIKSTYFGSSGSDTFKKNHMPSETFSVKANHRMRYFIR